jgi:hypothetical protein
MKPIEAALGLIELRSQPVAFINDRYPVRGKAAIVERDESDALVAPQAVECQIARNLEQPRLELRLGTPACTPGCLVSAKTQARFVASHSRNCFEQRFVRPAISQVMPADGAACLICMIASGAGYNACQNAIQKLLKQSRQSVTPSLFE